MKSKENLSGKPELTEENSGRTPAKFDAGFSGKDFTGHPFLVRSTPVPKLREVSKE